MADPFVTTQQPLASDQKNPVLHSSGPVTVRSARDSPEDGTFIGEVVVDGFEGKIVHATSRSRLPLMVNYYENSTRGRPPQFYERFLIAEYNGERAGVCVLRYRGDKERFPDRDEDMPSYGCCDMIGLCLLEVGTHTDIPDGKAYVDHICVSSKFRGKGVGKVLLDTADADGKKRGCKSIFLWVSTSNRAQHLYERQGYVLKETKSWCCGCCTYCMTGEKEFALMEKDLQ